MNAKLSFSIITLLVAVEVLGAPRLVDSRYDIHLFAAAPDIVTPIGAEVDPSGRLYVIESHTLMTPEDYQGPKHDRIKVFEDADHDGIAEKITIFADRFVSALRLTFGPDGSLYVGCSKAIWRLEDRNGDGRAETRKRIVTFETDDPFPWGYLDGMAFSAEGDLYFNSGFAVFSHRTLGSDGSVFSGYGDGGSVLRCRADGSGLELFATGLWASPALGFDPYGRLLMVDNDPVSQGPNRLIHCVEQGDYGFRIIYGFGGNSPLLGISGELASSLPAINITGESPSDLLICATSRFPQDMAKAVLVSLWGDNAIERHELKPSGPTLQSIRSTWLQGGADFRPVDLVAAPSGVIYVTDWVKNDFRSHGDGRIWRIVPKSDLSLEDPMKVAAARKLKLPNAPAAIRAALRSKEPLDRHAASLALARPERIKLLEELSRDTDPRIRLGALVAFRRLNPVRPPELLADFLNDADERVRHAAVTWIGGQSLTGWGEALRKTFSRSDATPRLLQASLAALAALDPEFVEACVAQAGAPFEKLPQTLPDVLTHELLSSKELSATAKVTVLPWLDNPAKPETQALLKDLSESADPQLNLAALEVLAHESQGSNSRWLLKLVKDLTRNRDLRAKALATVASQSQVGEILPFLGDDQQEVQIEAVIALRHALALDESKQSLVQESLNALLPVTSGRVKAEIRFALGRDEDARPSDLEGWQTLLASGGNAVIGRRRFFSMETQCVTCHSIGGHGGRVGPDLGMLARSQTRREIIRSIIRPSAYFGPEYQTWELEQKDGEILSGALLGVEKDGAATLMLPTGQTPTVSGSDVKHLRGLSSSMMPQGLEMGWSTESLRDVVAFLTTMR